MQQFDPGIAFATDLIDAGLRWLEGERMSRYWAKILQLRMHHVQYGTLISGFENEVRKLIDFLGQPWESACLEF